MEQLRPGLQVTPNLRLVRPIGKGGMGSVWVAEHKKLETQVVVKFLADDVYDKEDAAARFDREAAAAAAVKSPHVVTIHDHGTTDDGQRYIVMELLEGRDLATHLEQNGKMAPRDVAAMVGQVAKALTKAHQVGIVHRDIKPENVFLCDGEHGEMFVKVLDFGVAKWQAQMTSKTTTGQVVGTPYYMSPEQILGEQPVDGRSDIWSLGVVAFEALTGKRPFEGATIAAITLAIHHKKPRPRQFEPDLPAAVDDWFAMACMHNVEGRFATAREAAQAFAAAVGEQSKPALSMTNETSDPSIPIGGLQPKERAVTSLSQTFPAGIPKKQTPPKVIIGGAMAALAVLGIILYVALRSPAQGDTTNGTGVPASSASTVQAPIETASAPAAAVSAASAPSEEPPVAVSIASTHQAPAKPAVTVAPKPIVPGTTLPKKPPRKPNDDDIK